ncbi:hypothetical protein [Aeropyrum camini]|nr:hypothetical protein [Aeropyrum camini]
MEDGSKLSLEFDPEIELTPQAKLVLSHVEAGGERISSPRVEMTVTGPLEVRAVYDTYYALETESILGRSLQWVEAGDTATLYFPPEMPGGVFTRLRLSHVVVNGEEAPLGGGRVVVEVDSPKRVVAVYTVEPVAWRIALATIPLAILSTAAAAYLYRLARGL